MATLVVNGGRRLEGRITPSANKNAVLPVLCASLLTTQPVTLHGVPDVTDVRKLLAFFTALGSEVEADFSSGTVRLAHGAGLDPAKARLPSGMRSTIMLIPALLRRFGRAVLRRTPRVAPWGSARSIRTSRSCGPLARRSRSRPRAW